MPPTGVVTTAAYRALVDGTAAARLIATIRAGVAVDEAAVDEVFAGLEIPAAVGAAVTDLATRVGGGRPVAVRSSATVEDLAASSFAGQYRSVLDVDPADPDAVLDAVRMVFASLWHPAPCAYRRAFGIAEDDVAMAAVVMQMVPAERAGVVFTLDPAGDEDRARVEEVAGLGEALVSGVTTPDAWLVPRRGDPGDVPREVAEATALALEIETAEGAAQDVEWAFDGDRVWIVQARPITVTAPPSDDGFDDAPADVELTTAGIGEMLPGVLPPWRWQVASHLVNEAFARIVADLGAQPPAADRGLVCRIRGRAAMDLDALRALATELPGGSAEELEAQYFGARAADRPVPEHGPAWWRTIGHDVRSLALRRRASLDAEIVIHAVDHLGDDGDLSTLGDDELERRIFRYIDLAVRGTGAELAVAASATTSFRKIELILEPHLGATEATRWTERVTSGRGVAVAPEPGSSAAVFGGPTWTELGRRPPTTDELRTRLTSHRSADEDELFALLRVTATWGDGGLRAALRSRALRQLVAETAVLLHRREAAKAALLALGGRVRRLLLEQGRRLHAAGVLDNPSDVELLTPAEIRTALRGGAVATRSVTERARWRRRYEDEPPLPATFTGLPAPTPPAIPVGDRYDAWAVSPGRVTARARVARSAGDVVEPGSVLVAAATDASWSPLFLAAAGIVVERGGPLSHAAILARELGVPAVVNLPGACAALDGRTVTVDGDAGIVVVQGDEPPTETGAGDG